MRRITAPLAAIALLATTAQAQTNVTIYGVVDAALTWVDAGGKASSQKRMDSAVGPGSRLGFRGNEDLGGGLKAMFTLEMGLDPSSGSFQQGGLPFGRQIFVGLGGANWSVRQGAVAARVARRAELVLSPASLRGRRHVHQPQRLFRPADRARRRHLARSAP